MARLVSCSARFIARFIGPSCCWPAAAARPIWICMFSIFSSMLLHVVEQLAGLIARAGLGEVAQGLQHAGEFVVAHLLAAALHAALLLAAALGDVAVAQRFGHLGGEIVLDRLFVHIHQALDFFFATRRGGALLPARGGRLRARRWRRRGCRIRRAARYPRAGLRRFRPRRGRAALSMMARALRRPMKMTGSSK